MQEELGRVEAALHKVEAQAERVEAQVQAARESGDEAEVAALRQKENLLRQEKNLLRQKEDRLMDKEDLLRRERLRSISKGGACTSPQRLLCLARRSQAGAASHPAGTCAPGCDGPSYPVAPRTQLSMSQCK